MQENLKAYDLKNGQVNITIKGIPDICPICHSSVFPKQLRVDIIDTKSSSITQIVYRCTNQSCQNLFIATYNKTGTSGSRPLFTLKNTAPKTPYKESFSEVISSLSPAFIEIYNQALSAESIGLTQIVGIGFRKALEFLIKDFAIKENPDQEDIIRKAFLGKCISDYVKDSYVKECAKRASWLGNDEAHYTRKWEDKDVDDLKLLIRLTVNWIENVLLTESYIKEMTVDSDKKSKEKFAT